MSTLTATQLQQQYIAYFGRPGDPAGIKYWLSSSSGVSSAREFADKIYAQDEYKKSTVGSKSTEEQINGLYLNLFDRQADAAGLLYWTNQVENGTLTLSNIAFDLIAAASAPVAGNETQAALDAQALTNKVSAATAYTAEIEASTTAILAYQPSSTSPWVTGSAFEAGATFLKTATSSNAPTAADVTASVTTMSSTTGVAEGSNFTLTATTDQIVGTAGNDTITGSSSTFNSDDSIKGGAGSDSFTVTSAAAATVIGNFEAVETLKVTNGSATATDDYAINLIGATGVTEVQSRLSSAEVSFDNIQAAATVSSFGSQSGSAISAKFLNSLTSGTADSVNLKVDGGANTEFNVSGTTSANEFETINIESAGALKNTISGIKDNDGTPAALTLLETLNVSGPADLKITLSSTKAKATYDGSAATGDQTVVWGGGTTTLTTGSGDDQIDASATGFFGNTNPKALDGGAGTDTLTLSESVSTLDTTSSTTDHSVTGFETLEAEVTIAATGADTTYTIDVSKFTGITALKATLDNNDTARTGVGNGEIAAVVLNGIGTQSISFTSDPSGVADNDSNLTLKLTDDTGASDVVNITSAQPAAGKVNQLTALTLNRSAAVANAIVETVNLTVSAADVSTTDGTTLDSLDLTYANQLNLLGSGDLTLTALEIRDPSGTTNAILDASAYTGNLTTGAAFKATAGDNLTIKLGSGTNKVYLDAEVTASDVVEGSTGTDTVKIIDVDAALGSDTTGFTAKDVDIVQVYGEASAGAGGAISLVNFSNVGTVAVYDAGQGDSTNDNVTISNALAGQKFQMRSEADTEDWNGATLDIDNKKAEASTLDIELAGDTALEGTGILNTDAATVTITDNIKTSSFNVDNTLVIAGNSATEEIGALVLKGSGASSATATATLTISGTSNVDVSSIDASELAGNLTIDGLTTKAGATITGASTGNKYTISLADMARDAITLDGAGGTDTVIAATLDNATYVPGLKNVEKLEVTTDTTPAGTITLDGSDASAVTEVKISFGTDTTDATGFDEAIIIQNFANLATVKVKGGYGDDVDAADEFDIDDTGVTTIATHDTTMFHSAGVALADATDLTIKLGSSAADADTAELTAVTLTAPKATTLTLGGSDTDTAGTQWVGKIDIPTITTAKLTSLNINTGQGDIDVDTITAAKLATVTVTGDNDFVFGTTAAVTTALASFDGSASTGTITIGELVDFTSTASVKTGTANDTVSLSVLTEAGIALDLGEKTGDNDTLKIEGTNNLGLTVIDLTAADQILQINGVVGSGTETGIESVDASGMSGSQGLNITASSEANTIDGTPNADNIIAGGGIDTIEGNGGDDTIDLTETTAAADIVEIDTAATNGTDTITGFDVTVDIIDLLTNESQAAGAGAALTGYVAAGQAAIAATTGLLELSVELNSLDAAGMATAFGAGALAFNNKADEIYVLADNGTDSALFFLDGAAVANLEFVEGEDAITKLITFKGVADATSFAATNFSDFA